jgi:hypothetical protein
VSSAKVVSRPALPLVPASHDAPFLLQSACASRRFDPVMGKLESRCRTIREGAISMLPVSHLNNISTILRTSLAIQRAEIWVVLTDIDSRSQQGLIDLASFQPVATSSWTVVNSLFGGEHLKHNAHFPAMCRNAAGRRLHDVISPHIRSQRSHYRPIRSLLLCSSYCSYAV